MDCDGMTGCNFINVCLIVRCKVFPGDSYENW